MIAAVARFIVLCAQLGSAAFVAYCLALMALAAMFPGLIRL